MGDNLKLLIVDDDINMSETFFDILSDVGYDVDVANDGNQAIDKIKATNYDIVLMDVKMPGVNGVEVLKEINRLKPSVKVLMMTAYISAELVNEALKIGAYSVFPKPVNIDNLLQFFNSIEKSVNILIVDDDPEFCVSLKDNLDILKYEIIIKTSGKEAITYIKAKNKVDIVLLDMRMPLMNGLEVHLEIKKIDPTITTIMMSAYQEEEMKLGLEHDLYDFLYKPIEHEKIFSLIKQIAGRKIQSEQNERI